MPTVPSFRYEELLDKIGYGPFQQYLLFLCGGCLLSDAFEMLLFTFITRDLICEFSLSSLHLTLLSTSTYFGMLIGSYLIGYLSDRYGRKFGYILTNILIAIFGSLSSFSPDIFSLFIFRSFVGIGVGGASACISLISEWSPNSKRSRLMTCHLLFFSVGCVIHVGLAWLILPSYGWRILMFSSSLPSFILLFLSSSLSESPRFMIASGNQSEAIELLNKAASQNGIRLPPVFTILGDDDDDDNEDKEKEKEREKGGKDKENHPRLRHLFSSSLLLTTLLLSLLFFMMAMMYNAVIWFSVRIIDEGDSSPTTGCSPMTNQEFKELAITSGAEIPGLLLAFYFWETLGRRVTISLMFFLQGICLCLLSIPGISRSVNVGLLFLSRAFALGYNQSLWVYTTEIYPTVIRSTGIGWTTAFARLGGIASPFLGHHFFSLSPLFSLYFCISLSFLSSLLSLFLPVETGNRPLKDRL